MNGKTSITIGGKPVEIRFGGYANRIFSEASQKNEALYFALGSVNDDGTQNRDDITMEGLAKLVQCAYLNQHAIKETEPDPALTYETFCDLLNEMAATDDGKEEMKRILAVFVDSTKTNLPVTDEKKSEESLSTGGTETGTE